MKLEANTILITGGAVGIGFALAKHLCEHHNRVIICGRSEDALLKAQEKIPNLVTRVCDITDTTSRQAMVSWLETTYPELNVLINNAGVQFRRHLTDKDAFENIEQEVSVNFTAPVRLVGELLPLLQRQEEAAILNVSSALAFSPLADIPVYCATKAALHSFTLSLRHQLMAHRIRVVEVAPPIVETGLSGGERSGGTNGQRTLSADEFAIEALKQLEDGQDEVLVGLAANVRKLGETLFDRMNNR